MAPRKSLIAVIVFFALTAPASAQPFEISWYTIDGGGGTSTGGVFELSGTIGQHDAGVTHSGGLFQLDGGFWSGVLLVPPCPADLNNDGVLDFFDVQTFLNAFSIEDPIADFTGDGLFDFFDVQAFLNAFSAGCP
jgi:hypothetical protein